MSLNEKEIIATFDLNPKKAIEELKTIANNTNVDENELIANFLYKNRDNLNPSFIGEIIALRGNENILAKFVSKIDLSNKDFLTAFRFFLSHFELAGEAQAIQRVLTAFAMHFCEQNPESNIKSAEIADKLVNAIIFINNVLHNPKISNKISFDEFCRMYKESEYGGKKFIGSLYKSIKREELSPKKSLSSMYYTMNINGNIDETLKEISDTENFKTSSITDNHNFLYKLFFDYPITVQYKEGQAIVDVVINKKSILGGLFSFNSTNQLLITIKPANQNSIDMAGKIAAQLKRKTSIAPEVMTTRPYHKIAMQKALQLHDYDKAKVSNREELALGSTKKIP